MSPTLLLVVDPHPQGALIRVDRMRQLLGDAAVPGLVAGRGHDWAAIAIPPPGHEPSAGAIILQDGGDVLAWTGEMFLPSHWRRTQHEDARTGITLTVLDRLRQKGLDALADIDGAFCGAWFDAGRNRWCVFSDRLGSMPVFWAARDDRLVIATQAWLAWRGIGGPLEVDPLGVAGLIRTQNMLDDHTLIAGVHWLPRGHAVVWGEEGAGYLRYWDLDYTRPQIEDEREATARYVSAISSAIERHTRSEAPLLLGISGGLDSRIYLAVCEELGRVPDCFTAGWPFYEDVRYGRQLAWLAGASHEIAPLEVDTLAERLEATILAAQGMISAAHLAPTAAVQAYLANQTGRVLLEGFFHGMMGGCTVPADADVATNLAPHATKWARNVLHAGGSVELVNDLLEPTLARESYAAWASRIDEIYRTADLPDPLHRAEYTMCSSRRGRVDILGTAILRRDVLVRNPAADRALLEWHQTTSPRLRRARHIYIRALREYWPRYANVPRADGCHGLPISESRWRREYHWQMNKLRQRFIEWRYPWTRAWGSGNRAIRAWTFDAWRRSGRLDMLTAPDARVLNWVRRDRLEALWQAAVANPLDAQPILTLATLEVTLRWLEGIAGQASVDRELSQSVRIDRQAVRRQTEALVACGAP